MFTLKKFKTFISSFILIIIIRDVQQRSSTRVLEYSAVTAMIDHENDDREKNKINSDWL